MTVQTKIEAEKPTGLALLREPFPAHHISKLPKETKNQREAREKDRSLIVWRCSQCGNMHHKDAQHLDYVGHAALTDRLLDADPAWNWEPMALNPDGSPAFDQVGGLWIKLTVCGQTRLGYGHAEGKRGGDAIKEVIGDALRNAAMRFGAALDLWHKGDLHADEGDEAAPAQQKAKPAAAKQEKPAAAPQQAAADGMPDAMYSALVNTMTAAGVTPAAICQTYEVGNIRQLNRVQYEDAMNRLKDELAAKARKESNQRANRNDFAGADFAGTNF